METAARWRGAAEAGARPQGQQGGCPFAGAVVDGGDPPAAAEAGNRLDAARRSRRKGT